MFLGRSCSSSAAAGYVAKAIWLAEPCEPEVEGKKSPIVETGMEENLDVSTLFIVKCVAHIYIKKKKKKKKVHISAQ